MWGNAFSPAGIFDALPFCDAVHGGNGVNDVIGNILRTDFPIGFHSTAGGDDHTDLQFDGWPTFDTYTHQQMYYEWLRRAFDGGVRLIVVHAVNNRLLCDVNGHDPQFSCEDMATVDDQLLMAKSLEAFVDNEAGGPGLGWYRIGAVPDSVMRQDFGDQPPPTRKSCVVVSPSRSVMRADARTS